MSTSHRRYQYGAAATAVVLAAAASAAAYRGLHLVAVVFCIGAAVCLEAAARERRRHDRVVAECDWARRRALGMDPPPLDPCCHLGRISDGTAHRNCTDHRALPQEQ